MSCHRAVKPRIQSRDAPGSFHRQNVRAASPGACWRAALWLGSSFLGLYDIPGPPRLHHFCIGVEGFELDAIAERLRENALEPSFNRGVEVYFRDPDDILVQLSPSDYPG